MRPRDDVTFLREHGDDVIQVLLAGQGQRGHTGGELGVVDGVVEDGLREGAHVHLVALLLVQTVQEALHHSGLVGVHSHEQSLVNLPEVKLDPLQEGVHGVFAAQADGQVQSLPPLAILRLVQLTDDAIASLQEPTQEFDFPLLDGADELRRKAQLLVHDLTPLLRLGVETTATINKIHS